MLAIDEYHFTLGEKKGEKFHIEASSASRWPSTEMLLNQAVGLFLQLNILLPLLTSISWSLVRTNAV